MKALIRILIAASIIFSLCIPAFGDLILGTPKPMELRSSVILPPKKKRPRKSRQKLIDWITPKWVDVDLDGKNGTSSPEEGGMNGGSGLGTGQGNSGKGSGGKNSGSGGVGFNEDASKNGKQVDPGPKDENTGGPKTPPGSPPGEGDIVAYDKFYPMCIFIDRDATDEATGNAAVKGMVDDAAACGVNLVVFAYTVQPLGTDDDVEINKWQQATCNLNEKLASLGVKASSTTVCSASETAASKMCKDFEPVPQFPPNTPTKNVAGCAQLQRVAGPENLDNNPSAKARLSALGTPSYGGSLSAPSIEQKGACDKDTIGHEAQGHSQWGHPNGSGDGKGIGLGDDGKGGGEAGAGGKGGWDPAGCTQMKMNSYANDGRFKYNRKRQNYYFHDPNPKVRLQDMKKLFGPEDIPGDPGPDTPPPLLAGRDYPPVEIKQSPPGVRPDPPSRIAQAEQSKSKAPESKHKRKPGVVTMQDAVNLLLANSSTSTPKRVPPLEDSPLNDPTVLPPVTERNEFVGSQNFIGVGYNESASKNSATFNSTTSSGDLQSAGSFLSSSSSTTSSSNGMGVGYNEAASKSGESVSVSEVGSRSTRSGTSTSSTSSLKGTASADREPAGFEEDEEGVRRKKRPEDRLRRGKGKRKGGGALRKGKAKTIEIYQSSGFVDLP